MPILVPFNEGLITELELLALPLIDTMALLTDGVVLLVVATPLLSLTTAWCREAPRNP